MIGETMTTERPGSARPLPETEAVSVPGPRPDRGVVADGPRLDRAVARALAGAETAVVVPTESRREAEAVAAYLRRRGLQAEVVDVGTVRNVQEDTGTA